MHRTKNIANKNIIQILKETLTKNFININKRASRREFNFSILSLCLIIIFLCFSKALLKQNLAAAETLNILTATPLTIIIWWFPIPTICLIIRRSHDLNLSPIGLIFSLLPPGVLIFILILILKGGTKGPNKYGPNPYALEDNTQQTPEEILAKNKPIKIAKEKIKIKKVKEQKNFLDPNNPSYKI